MKHESKIHYYILAVKYNSHKMVTYPEYLKFFDEVKRVKMFFYARLSKTPHSWGTFVDSQVRESENETLEVITGYI